MFPSLVATTDWNLAGSGDIEVVKELMSLGCDPLAIDHTSWSPLMWASAGGHVPVIQELMSRGASIHIKDNQGRWPLHWAAEKGHVDAVDLLVRHLLQAGADLHTAVSHRFCAQCPFTGTMCSTSLPAYMVGDTYLLKQCFNVVGHK